MKTAEKINLEKFKEENKVIEDKTALKEIMVSGQNRILFMAENHLLSDVYKNNPEIMDGYYLSAMFDLSAILHHEESDKYKYTEYKYPVLYEFTNEKTDLVKIGKRITGRYEEHSKEIEQWLNENLIPENTDVYKFNYIKFKDINYNFLYPYYHDQKGLALTSYFKSKKTLPLNSVAKFYQSTFSKDNFYHQLGYK